VLTVGGTVPARDHKVAGQSKNCRCSTNHQIGIDADTRLVVVVGRPLPGNRNDCLACAESGAKAAVGDSTTIADGGYPGVGLVMPHRGRGRGTARLDHLITDATGIRSLSPCPAATATMSPISFHCSRQCRPCGASAACPGAAPTSCSVPAATTTTSTAASSARSA
jgi:hypothetical protein